jgi:hypothetical protein
MSAATIETPGVMAEPASETIISHTLMGVTEAMMAGAAMVVAEATDWLACLLWGICYELRPSSNTVVDSIRFGCSFNDYQEALEQENIKGI